MQRKEYKNQILWFDSGDQFTGTIENIESKGQLMIDFYNAMKVDSVALGNHEWDEKELQLKKWMTNEKGRFAYLKKQNKKQNKNNKNKNKKNKGDKFSFSFSYKNKTENNYNRTKTNYNNNKKNLNNNFDKDLNNSNIDTEFQNLYLISNLKLKSFNKSEDLPNKMLFQIFKFLDGKIKIGVIGLMTLETIGKTSGFPNNKFIITNYYQAIQRQVNIIREKGATAVLALTHVGLTCKDPKWDQSLIDEYYKIGLRSKDTKQTLITKNKSNR